MRYFGSIIIFQQTWTEHRALELAGDTNTLIIIDPNDELSDEKISKTFLKQDK